MILQLPLGRELLGLDFADLPVQLLASRAPAARGSAAELARSAVTAPLAGPPLAVLARGWQRAVILVPDATRKAALPQVLPQVLGALVEADVPLRGVTVLVACGTHPRSEVAELAALLGPLPEGVTVVQHDARDETVLLPAGRLASGQVVRLHRLVLECDGLVAVSTVQHHYFAGFGGGPKLVFPGVAGYEEIQVNHSRVLELGLMPRRHPGCEPGQIAGNPVAEEIAAAAALRSPDMLVALVNGDDGSPRWTASGPPGVVFSEACTRVRQWFEVEGGPFHRMVASAGGHPGDHTLIQAHKALDAACRFLLPGGELLFVADLGGGSGSPAMDPFLADPRPGSILARLAEGYVQYGHTALRLVEKTTRFTVTLSSRLEEGVARRLHFLPVAEPGTVLDRWRRDSPSLPIGVFPGAPVYPSRLTRSE